MPRRRTPQGAPRKRRPVRRPEFQPAPEPEPQPEDDAVVEPPPTFADEPVMAIPGFGATGPVETRPAWRTQQDRAQGRRMSQIRRGLGEGPARSAAATGQLPVFERSFITRELRSIAITTGTLLALLVVLTFVLR